MSNPRGPKRLAGVDEMLTAMVELARTDMEAVGMPRDWVCMSSHGDEDEGVPILDPAIPPCVRSDCSESRPHHHVSSCGRVLIGDLAAAVERREDPMGSLLEIVSR